MSRIFKHSDISVDQINLGTPKVLDNGGKIIGLYHKGAPFIMQTVNMPCLFGMKKWEGKDNMPDKYNIDVSFKNVDSNPAVADFLNVMKDLDERLIQEGINNSSAWFKRKTDSRDVVEALYTPIVKYSKDKDTGDISTKYPPSVRFQIPFKNGEFDCEAYDVNRNLVNLNNINTKGMYMTAIIQCNGIWVAGGKFGCNFKILQMRVAPRVDAINGYAFVDDNDRI